MLIQSISYLDGFVWSWGDAVFEDRETLDCIGETFVYTDLLNSILAMIVFYDAIKLRDKDLRTVAEAKAESDRKIEQLTERVDALERKLNELLLLLSSLK